MSTKENLLQAKTNKSPQICEYVPTHLDANKTFTLFGSNNSLKILLT